MALQNQPPAYVHYLPQWGPMSVLTIEGTWRDKYP